MACFDEFDNDETQMLSLQGKEMMFQHYTAKESALFPLGEHIKNKRNAHELMVKKPDERN